MPADACQRLCHWKMFFPGFPLCILKLKKFHPIVISVAGQFFGHPALFYFSSKLQRTLQLKMRPIICRQLSAYENNSVFNRNAIVYLYSTQDVCGTIFYVCFVDFSTFVMFRRPHKEKLVIMVVGRWAAFKKFTGECHDKMSESVVTTRCPEIMSIDLT